MTSFVGLDVSVDETSICVLDDDGVTRYEGKATTDPVVLATVLTEHAPDAARMGLEAGSSSSWLCRELKRYGLPIIHMESRHAHRALSMRLNKTDKNDARGLAELMKVGWFKAAHPKSVESNRIRFMLLARKKLVDTKRQYLNQIRGIMKGTGTIIGSTAGRKFAAKVAAACKSDPILAMMCKPLLAVIATIDDQLKVATNDLLRYARNDQTTRRLMTVPGIGAITALAFISAIDEPTRFKRSADVGAYLGLTPRRHQSGEMDWTGRISKVGDGLARTYLFEAAAVLISRIGRWSVLKAWGVKLSKRIGMRKARVAVARKMAVILHCIWIDGTEFEWGEAKAT